MAAATTKAASGAGDILGTGRRKSSVARVRLRPGGGQITINERPLDEYFHNVQQRNAVLATLVQTGKLDQVDVVVRVDGGGITGQADAIKLGLAHPSLRLPARAVHGWCRAVCDVACRPQTTSGATYHVFCCKQHTVTLSICRSFPGAHR